jgi:hypothetical protein
MSPAKNYVLALHEYMKGPGNHFKKNAFPGVAHLAPLPEAVAGKKDSLCPTEAGPCTIP